MHSPCTEPIAAPAPSAWRSSACGLARCRRTSTTSCTPHTRPATPTPVHEKHGTAHLTVAGIEYWLVTTADTVPDVTSPVVRVLQMDADELTRRVNSALHEADIEPPGTQGRYHHF